MSNHIHLQKSDIRFAHWQNKELVIRTKSGGLAFTCPCEQWQAVQALKTVGFRIADPPLTTAQKWLKACHHVVNAEYFSGVLSTPYFEIAEHPRGYEGWYNVDKRAIGFSKSAYKAGFDNHARWLLHTMLHECIHQFVHEYGNWQKGIDPHLEEGFIEACSIMTTALGLPAKTEWTLAELKEFPQCLIQQDYYTYKSDTIRPAYHWR